MFKGWLEEEDSVLGNALVHLCVPRVQHSLSQKYLKVDSMVLKRDFRNEDMISGVIVT